MKKFLSTAYTDTAFNVGTFLLRVVFGFMMCLHHGIPKIADYSDLQHKFFNLFHIGSRPSLVLSIVAEVFASMFLILGLFSRVAALLLVLDMGVAIFIFNKGNSLNHYEDAVMYFSGFLFLLLAGPGKYSVDGLTGR